MRLLRAADYRRMPWKNGGGETTEIAVSPEGSGLDDFVWRVSMARVEQGGPFSLFPGVDRTLSILEGDGLLLDIAGRTPASVTSDSAPLSFPADAQTSAQLLGRTVTDLNVMTRRGRVTHQVKRFDLGDQLTLVVASETLVFCDRGSIAVSVGGKRSDLGPRDAFHIDGKDHQSLHLTAETPALIFVIDFDLV